MSYRLRHTSRLLREAMAIDPDAIGMEQVMMITGLSRDTIVRHDHELFPKCLEFGRDVMPTFQGHVLHRTGFKRCVARIYSRHVVEAWHAARLASKREGCTCERCERAGTNVHNSLGSSRKRARRAARLAPARVPVPRIADTTIVAVGRMPPAHKGERGPRFARRADGKLAPVTVEVAEQIDAMEKTK